MLSKLFSDKVLRYLGYVALVTCVIAFIMSPTISNFLWLIGTAALVGYDYYNQKR